MPETTESAVLTERRDNILIITINRPDKRNAVNKAVADGIGDAAELLDTDDTLTLGILTGAGGGFCAGMDLKGFASGETPWHPTRGFGGIAQQPPLKPLIAAVEGFAVAGGLEIALACDMLVAAKGAKLGVPEVKRSLVAAGGALLRLPRKLPLNVATEMALTGDPISAERGYELGLVNRLAEPGSALDAAVELAEQIARNGPLALGATKQILEARRDWTDEEFWDKQMEIAGPVFGSEDAQEGAVAFTEKREPVWKGR